MTTLFLLRHAQSIPNPELPEPDWVLTERGRNQARDLIEPLAALGVTKVYSSPYLRTLETIRPFLEQTQIDCDVITELHERIGGGFFETQEAFYAAMEIQWKDKTLAFAGGESNGEARARFCRTVADLIGENEGETVLVSAHGMVIALFLETLDPSVDFQFWRTMKNPDLFKLRLEGGSLTWDREFEFRF